MRRESVQEILERVSTPLVPMGGEAPKILDVPENVTVVESMQSRHHHVYSKKKKIAIFRRDRNFNLQS